MIYPDKERARDRILQWIDTSPTSRPPITQKSSLEICFLGSRYLYKGLQKEGSIRLLTKDNYRAIFEHSKPDFLLVESSFENADRTFYFSQNPENPKYEDLTELVKTASLYNIPSVYWYTKDVSYLHLFEEFSAIFDHVYSADIMALEQLKIKLSREIGYLPLAIQPADYQRIKCNEMSKEKKRFILLDGLADFIRYQERMPEELGPLWNTDLALYDSTQQIWKERLDAIRGSIPEVLGTVYASEKPSLLDTGRAYLSLSSSSKSASTQQQLVLEAVAAGLPCFHLGTEAEDLRQHFVCTGSEALEVLIGIGRNEIDPLYMQRNVHLGWRLALTEYAYDCRLQTICEDLSIDYDWNSTPKASLVSATMRPHQLDHLIKQYMKQCYSNRELVVVCNGDPGSFSLERYSSKFLADNNIRFLHIPGELNAATCMNCGIQAGKGEYVFRFDDDDLYGEHYISDMMLYRKCCDFDVFGQRAKYFTVDDSAELYEVPGNAQSLIWYQGGGYLISGNTLSGKRTAFLENPYPEVLGAADSELKLDFAEQDTATLLTDPFNMIFCRDTDGAHTWEMSLQNLCGSRVRQDMVL